VFETVATVEDPAVARVLLAALRAHGFHPREGAENGLPGFSGVYGLKGTQAIVTCHYWADGRVLAEALVKEMLAR